MTEATTSAARTHEASSEAELSATAVHDQRIQGFIDKVNDILLDNTIVLEEHEPTITAARQTVNQPA